MRLTAWVTHPVCSFYAMPQKTDYLNEENITDTCVVPFRDGRQRRDIQLQLLIIRDGRTYNAQGLQVK